MISDQAFENIVRAICMYADSSVKKEELTPEARIAQIPFQELNRACFFAEAAAMARKTLPCEDLRLVTIGDLAKQIARD